MDGGFDSIEKIARLRLVNMKPTLNKNIYVYNGTYNSLLQVNPWNSVNSF